MIHSSTARFEDRVLTLKGCFEAKRMLDAWTKYVLPGFRSQPILDLHDYYDFHKNRKEKIEVIIRQVIGGTYRPKPPIIVRLEKKHGVSRHLPIPSPEDAVILQTLSDYLSPYIEKSQPSKRAFYSRAHGFISEENIDESFPYAWWQLWPEFQKRIYKFTSQFNYVVVTDVSNYYDNIQFKHLRHNLASAGQFDEPVLDLLFYLLESFLWRPDYLPITGVGLPQLNFDAPRLLAHSFLFDIDKYLHNKTKGNFVRWMDDIDFGVDSIQEAKVILKELDEILLVKGLRLNMGKTKILSSAEAKDYFLPDENRWINVMSNRIDYMLSIGKPINIEVKKVRNRFRKFLRKPHVGRWSKVYCRYFTLAHQINDDFLDKYVPGLLDHNPEMRDNIFKYYSVMGYSKQRLKCLMDFYEGSHCVDECTVFAVVKVLIAWKVKCGSSTRKSIVDLANRTLSISKTHFVAGLWLLAKYGLVTDIYIAINSNVDLWKYSGFIARQVASIIPRIRNIKAEYDLIVKSIYRAGQLDALNILYHHDSMRDKVPSTLAEMSYFMHGSAANPMYPLQKVIMIENILSNNAHDITKRRMFQAKVLTRIVDPVYIEIIKSAV
ncbi:RNA-directed DNA polymerase [Hymenobacter sp. DG01]|uniref:RNA-directed DNA polymerase n=1 Tax=Hymenobacter sp. DG01 TaxID=2584940 RepID=UPI001122C3D9|nr:RNA-directed DNA polymerase [Hymenobacter sp. DG01]